MAVTKIRGPQPRRSSLAAARKFAYIETMKVEAIKEAIAGLPADEKTRLATWIIRQDMMEWDRQIEEDFTPGGRGMALLEEAEADVREGRARPLDDVLAEARAARKSQSKRRR
jgi:hypothetical protein